MSHTDVDPCRAAGSSKLWCFKGMPASLRLEWNGEDKMFKQDKFTDDLGGEAAQPAASVCSSSTPMCFVARAGREVWYIFSKRKDGAMEG